MRIFNEKHLVVRFLVLAVALSMLAASVFTCRCHHLTIEQDNFAKMSFNNSQNQVDTGCCHRTDSPENSCQKPCKKLECVFARKQKLILEQKQSVLAFTSLHAAGFISRDLVSSTSNTFIDQKINTDINPPTLCVFRY